MKLACIFALGAAAMLAAPTFALAQSNDSGIAPARVAPRAAAPSFLANVDVTLYRDIFAAQDKKQFRNADDLIDKLTDKSLVGYVLQQRYLGPGYSSTYTELAAWLSKYGDHFEADRVRALAMHKKPKKAKAPAGVVQARWRGQRYDLEINVDLPVKSPRAETLMAQFRAFARDDHPGNAEAALLKLTAGPNLPQADIDRLACYVASAYLAQGHDEDAFRLSENLIARSANNAALSRWTAGLAAYRMGQFDTAAAHFEKMIETSGASARNIAGGAFWAARARIRAGQPERVVALLTNASYQPDTFYGMLSARLLGNTPGHTLTEPTLEPESFAALMQTPAARRAVAFWQLGDNEAAERELGRAFGDISPELDPAFAALARALELPTLELRAAETAAHRSVYLTSLYPMPAYVPEDGFRIDRAVLFAIARQESRFDVDARSRAGARGLMQLMPQTAAGIAKDRTLANKNGSKLDDPVFNLTLGQRYLSGLLERQNGNLVEMVAAYNAGPNNLSRWIEAQADKSDPLLFIESIPTAETRDYIKRLMVNLWMYRLNMGEPMDGLDDFAAGKWPQYRSISATTAEN